MKYNESFRIQFTIYFYAGHRLGCVNYDVAVDLLEVADFGNVYDVEESVSHR